MILKPLFLGLGGTNIWAAWYNSTASILSAIGCATVVALILLVLFYYVLPKKKALTSIHYVLFMLLSCLMTGVVVLFVGREMLIKYSQTNLLDQIDPAVNYIIAHFPLDLIQYAIISIFYGAIMFFVLSLVLKIWSVLYMIPFGQDKVRKIAK